MPRAVTTAVVVRFSPEQRERIGEAAAADGLSPGPWLRNMALERARHVLDEPHVRLQEVMDGLRRQLAAPKKG